MIVLWNTIYMDAVLTQRNYAQKVLRFAMRTWPRLDPLGFDHINMLGPLLVCSARSRCSRRIAAAARS